MLRANTRARHTREHALSPPRKDLNASGRVSRTKVSAALCVLASGTRACVGLQSRKYKAPGGSLAQTRVRCRIRTRQKHDTDTHMLLKLWVCS